MSILFEVNTSTLVASEAHALAGFLDQLFPGRLATAPAGFLDQLFPGRPATAPAFPGVPKAAPAPAPLAIAQAPQAEGAAPTPATMAEALMAAETARVAAQPQAEGEPVKYPVMNAHGIEVDVEGLPWDKRIHSESKGVLKGGAWKIRRNLPEGMEAQVKAELRAAMNAPAAVPVAIPVQVPPAPQAGVVVPPAPQAAGVQVPPAPTNVPVIQVEGSGPVTLTASAAQVDHSTATFADLMGRVVDLNVAGIQPADINAICARVGLTQPRDANLRPDLIPQLMTMLAAFG